MKASPLIRRTAVVVAAGFVIVGCSASSRGSAAVSKPATPGPLPVTAVAGTGSVVETQGPYAVTHVIDGATVELDRGREGGVTTVRLLGVAAPEVSDPARCFGAEASAAAHQLVDGQRVRIMADPGPRSDGQGRPLVYMWLESGRMANEVLVETGSARESIGGLAYLYRPSFAIAEERARQEGRGLWSGQTCDGNIAKATPS